MMFDLNGMRTLGRVFIRDPNGDALSDNSWRDDYLNPVYEEWWRRFEERPGFGSSPQLINPGVRSVGLVAAGGVFNETVYRLTVSLVSAPTIEFQLRRSEWNRLRNLQETEARRGLPEEWAAQMFQVGGNPEADFAFYPIPDAQYYINLYGRPFISPLLTVGTSSVVLDPVSARYVVRLAAHRAAINLKLPPDLIDGIAAPLPEWVKVHFNIDYQTQHKTIPQSEAPGYARSELEPARN